MRKANLREGEAKGSQLKGDQRKKIQMRKFLSKKMRVHFKIKGISILKLFDVSLKEKKNPRWNICLGIKKIKQYDISMDTQNCFYIIIPLKQFFREKSWNGIGLTAGCMGVWNHFLRQCELLFQVIMQIPCKCKVTSRAGVSGSKLVGGHWWTVACSGGMWWCIVQVDE